MHGEGEVPCSLPAAGGPVSHLRPYAFELINLAKLSSNHLLVGAGDLISRQPDRSRRHLSRRKRVS